MRKSIWAAVAFTMIFSACGTPPQVQVKDWPMVGRDSTQNRIVAKDEKFEYPKTDVIAWKQYMMTEQATQLIVANGKVFSTWIVRNKDGNATSVLGCFDAFTGKKLWSENIYIGGYPVYSNGNLIFKQNDDTLICIESETRKMVWSSKIDAGGHYEALVENGCFVINETKGILCFDEKTGKILWEKAIPKNGVFQIASSNGRLYYYSYNQKQLFCVNLGDGKEIWKLESLESFHKLVAYGDKLFFSDNSPTLHCIDDKGRELWNSEFEKPGQDDHYGWYLEFCIVDNKIYAIDTSQNLHCLNAVNGGKLFVRSVPNLYSEITFYDDCIYFISDQGICIEDLTDKGRSTRIELVDYYMPYAIAYGNIYLNSLGSGLLCVNATSGTNAIKFNQSKEWPILLLNDGKCWVGVNDNKLAIFKNDKLLWKSPDEIVSINLEQDKPMSYLDYENHIVYIGIDKALRFACIEKKTGKTIWEKPLENYFITGFDKKTVKLENNYGNIQTIDVVSGKTDYTKKLPSQDGLDEFTEFAISLVSDPCEFNFRKINDHQYLIHQYSVGGKGTDELGLLVINNDGNVIYELCRKTEQSYIVGLDYLSCGISSDKNKLYVSYHFSAFSSLPGSMSSEGEPTSKEIDLATGKVSDYAAQDFPQDATVINHGYIKNDDQDPNSFVKNIAFQGVNITDADFEKKTGVKPLIFEKDSEYVDFTPYASNHEQKLGNSTVCYRIVTYPGPDRTHQSVDYFHVFDTKTWKSLWECKGAQTDIKQVGDKFLLVECDEGLNLVDTDTGKVAYKIDNANECSIIGDILFAAQRKTPQSKSVVIKAVNLRKIIDKFK